jgi:hypothetical protein
VFKRKAALAGLFAGAPPTSISASTDLVLESAAKPLVDGAQGWHLDRAAVGHRLRSHHRPAGIIGSAAINVIGSASGDITGSSSLAKPIGQTSVCYPSGSPAGRAGGTLGARRQAR